MICPSPALSYLASLLKGPGSADVLVWGCVHGDVYMVRLVSSQRDCVFGMPGFTTFGLFSSFYLALSKPLYGKAIRSSFL